jgi:hypothetical protein
MFVESYVVASEGKKPIFGTPTAGFDLEASDPILPNMPPIQRKLLWRAGLRLSGSALTDRAPSRCSVYAPTLRCSEGSRNWRTDAPKEG